MGRGGTVEAQILRTTRRHGLRTTAIFRVTQTLTLPLRLLLVVPMVARTATTGNNPCARYSALFTAPFGR
jgi:hypothetical protein